MPFPKGKSILKFKAKLVVASSILNISLIHEIKTDRKIYNSWLQSNLRWITRIHTHKTIVWIFLAVSTPTIAVYVSLVTSLFYYHLLILVLKIRQLD